jgi:DNA-binding response OmpR family regulator
MVTARTQEEDRLIGEETGADEYINKPFDIESILERINMYLKGN